MASGGIVAGEPRLEDGGELHDGARAAARMGLVRLDPDQRHLGRRGPRPRARPGGHPAEPAGRRAAPGVRRGGPQAFTALTQTWRRAPDTSERGPFRYLHGGDEINAFLHTVVPEAEEEVLTAQPQSGARRPARHWRDVAGGRARPARARGPDPHALPAQRPAQHRHPRLRRRAQPAGRRGAHPGRVLQPDDRRRPADRRDPVAGGTCTPRSRSGSRRSSPTWSTCSCAPGSGPGRSPARRRRWSRASPRSSGR